MISSTSQERTEVTFIDASERTPYPELLLRVALAVWVLGYYFVPNTMLERISPGGLLLEFSRPSLNWLYLLAGAVIGMLSVLSLWKRQIGTRLLAPPFWLIASLFCLPLAAAGFMSHDDVDYRIKAISVVVAIASGILAARIAGKPQQTAAALSVAAFAQAVYTVIYQREQVNQLISGSVHRAGGTFHDPNNLYLLFLIALPFAVIGSVQAKNGLVRLAYLLAGSVEFTGLMLTWFRAGAIGLALSLTALTYFLTRSKRMSAIVFGCLAVLCVFVQGVRSSGQDNTASIRGSNAGRVYVWQKGWSSFISHPMTGVGIGSFHVVVRSVNGTETTIHVQDDPKDLLLDWLAERGIAGGVLFGLFVWTITATIRRSLPDRFGMAVGAAWVALATVALVDTPFGTPGRYAGNCCFGLLLGITAMLPMPLANEATPPSEDMNKHALEATECAA